MPAKIKIANLTRDRLIFEVLAGGNAGDKHVLIGDKLDTEDRLPPEIRAKRDKAKMPEPVLTVTMAVWEKWGSEAQGLIREQSKMKPPRIELTELAG